MPSDYSVERPHGPDVVTLAELVAMLRRSWLLIAVCIAAALAGGFAYLKVATPLYRSTTSILVDPRQGAINTELSSQRLSAESGMIDSQVRLIGSQTVLRRVVAAEKLAQDREFIGEATGRAGDLAARQAEALRELADRLVVTRAERTFIIDVGVFSSDPVKAARLSDAVAKAFIDDQVDARLNVFHSESAFITERLAELQARLHEAETRVEDYRKQHGIVLAKGALFNEQQLADLNVQLSAAQGRTAIAKAKYDQLRGLLAAGREAESTSDVLDSRSVERLRAQYALAQREEQRLRMVVGPRHPQLRAAQEQTEAARRQVSEEVRRLGEALRNDYEAARRSEATLAARFADAERGMREATGLMVKMRELEREVETSRATYERFLAARGNVAQERGEGARLRIIAQAVPALRPSKPSRPAILLLALAGGAVLGIVAALLRGRVPPPADPSHAGRAGRPVPGPALLPYLPASKPSRNAPSSRVRRALDAARADGGPLDHRSGEPAG